MAKRSGNIDRNSTRAVGNTIESVDGNRSDAESATGESDGIDPIAANGSDGDDSSEYGNSPNYVDPATATATSDSGTGTGKRRGRKPGTKNKPRGTSTSQATADLSGMLFTAHLFMAKMLKSEVIEITKEESEELSSAITRVTQLYDVALLSEKNWAFLNLAMVMGNIYGTRLAVISKQSKKKANVVDMSFTPIQQAQ